MSFNPMQIILRFVKDWTLPIAITLGALLYFVYVSIPVLQPYSHMTMHLITVVQPLLIFSMLFVSFCKVDPTQFRFARWHVWGLLLQTGVFWLFVGLLLVFPEVPHPITVEGTMLSFMCPTAAAAVVLNTKLGGNNTTLVTYTLLVNLVVAVAIPAAVPLIHPHEGQDFMVSFWMIMGKIFPMLICPLFAAIVVRYVFPAFHKRVIATRDLSFYIWSVSLCLAVAVSTKCLMRSHVGTMEGVGLAVGSLIACAVQFWTGHKLGLHYSDTISSSQAIGQKNTVFFIWCGYTFFDPLSSLAGGFYSIWHNVWNTYQLRLRSKQDACQTQR